MLQADVDLNIKIDEAIRQLKNLYLTDRYTSVRGLFYNSIRLLEDLKNDSLNLIDEFHSNLIDAKKLKDEENIPLDELRNTDKSTLLECILHGTAINAISQQFLYDDRTRLGLDFLTMEQVMQDLLPHAHSRGANVVYPQYFRPCYIDANHQGNRLLILIRGYQAVTEHLIFIADRGVASYKDSDYFATGFFPVPKRASEDLYLNLYKNQEWYRSLRKAGRIALTVLSGVLVLPLFFTIPWVIAANKADDLNKKDDAVKKLSMDSAEYEAVRAHRKRTKQASSALRMEATLCESSHTLINHSLEDMKIQNKPSKVVCPNKDDRSKVDLYMDGHQLARFNLFKELEGKPMTDEDLTEYAKNSPVTSLYSLRNAKI